MSHFTVMIIGPDPDGQLAKYDEGLDGPKRFVNVVSQEEKKSFIDFYIDKHPERAGQTFEELYEEFGYSWNGNTWELNSETGEYEDYTTYNEDSKWDWYCIGGRWAGFLRLKNPNQVIHGDQALKGEIDFEGMKDEAGEEARETYEKAANAFGGVIPTLDYSWNTIVEEKDPIFVGMEIDKKRNFYHNQPAMLEAKKHTDVLGHFFDFDDYQCTLEEFVERARNNALSTYAYVKDGEWIGKGDMGWWGMSSNDEDQNVWNGKMVKLLEELPDDTLITIMDCHI
jgi:hypothetical protein